MILDNPPSITALLYLPDGCLAVGVNHAIQLWDARAEKRVGLLGGIADSALCLALSPDGTTLAVGSGTPTVAGEISLYEVRTQKLLRRFGKEHRDMVFALAFSPDGQTLFSASGDKTLRLWDTKTGSAKKLLRDHADAVYALALSPDGKTLASAGVDRSIKLWDAQTGQARFTFTGRTHGDTIYALAFAPGTSQHLVSASGDGTTKLWHLGGDAESTEAFRSLPSAPTHAAAFSPDGKLLVTATKDSMVQLWSGTGGGWLRTLTGASDWLYTTVFSPDGKTVAAAGFAGKVWLWDAATGASRGTIPPSLAGGGQGEAKISPAPVVKKLAESFAFPEGPAYDGKGSVVVSNSQGNTINKINKDGNAVLFTADPKKFTFGKSNGLAYGDDNALYACDFGRKAIVRIFSDGRTELYADKCEEQGFKGPNDLAFDPEGNLYLTDPVGSDAKNPIGCVYRIEKGSRRVTRVASGLAFPNGIALSADAKTLFIAESKTFRLLKATIKPDGSLEPPQVFCQLPENHVPDGIGFDQAGNLYVATYGQGCVTVLTPDGNVARTLAVPGSSVTNVEFGGKDYKTLYITEAKTGALYTIEVAIGGLPLFRAPQNEVK